MRRYPVAVLAALGSTAALAACATTDDARREDLDPLPDASSSPESSAPAEDASPDANADAPADDRCSKGGFCPVPVPLEGPLLAVSASSADDAWVVTRDTMARRSGATWEYVYQYSGSGQADDRFYGLWVSKRDDVWAFGRGFVVRYGKQGSEPSTARRMDAPRAGSVAFWVTPDADAVWVATSTSQVYRYREETHGTLTEESFTPRSDSGGTGTYRWHSVWGFAPDDVYFGGDYCRGSCGGGLGGSKPRGAIARYDGTSYTIGLLGEDESARAMFGTTGSAEPRRLWTWVGPAPSQFGGSSGVNTVRLFPAPLPVDEGGAVSDPLFAETITVDTSGAENAWCDRVFGSAVSATDAWLADGCRVYRWNGAALEMVATVVQGLPLGKMNGLWAGGDQTWIVGEAVPQGPSAPKMGFAAHRGGER